MFIYWGHSIANLVLLKEAILKQLDLFLSWTFLQKKTCFAQKACLSASELGSGHRMDARLDLPKLHGCQHLSQELKSYPTVDGSLKSGEKTS